MKDIYVERKRRLTSLVYLDGILPVNIATAILSKDWFSEKILVKRGTRTPCTACLKKKILFHCTHSVSSLCTYRLRTVTHDYMKL